jgi:hypothetical protein
LIRHARIRIAQRKFACKKSKALDPDLGIQRFFVSITFPGCGTETKIIQNNGLRNEVWTDFYPQPGKAPRSRKIH